MSAAPELDVLSCPLDGIRLVEASAGTGKTWNICGLYLRLLLERALPVESLLVVTFTKAATAELSGRIRARIAETLGMLEGAVAAEDPFVTRLIDAALGRGLTHEQIATRLRLALQTFDEAAIFTIHGFCQRALQDSAFEAGGDFDAELTQDDREVLDALLGDAWRHVLADADPAWARFLAKQRITPATLRQALRSQKKATGNKASRKIQLKMKMLMPSSR